MMRISSSVNDDEQWAPISDLMAALMLIFMLIAVVYIRTVVDQQAVFKQECDKIYRELKTEFSKDFDVWQVNLLEDLTIQFRNPEVLFLTGSDEIRPYFERILENFFPRYMESISEYKNDIKEIRIEGHTSSEYEAATGGDEAYFLNMELSQERTRAILQYVLNLPEANSYVAWAKSHITANGLSSSKLIYVNGKEDRNLSRRVEFRLLTNSCQKAGVYNN